MGASAALRGLCCAAVCLAAGQSLVSELAQFHESVRPPPPPQSVVSAPAPATRRTYGGLVFVKTYKTGSTSVAEFVAAVGYQLQLHSLHPRGLGHFVDKELEQRARNGERYDLSFRHPTPRLDVISLGSLVPSALWITIIREPVGRFVSTFVFVKKLALKYQYSPQKLVAAVAQRQLSDGDANSFCNNVAMVLSPAATEAYAYPGPNARAEAISAEIIERVQREGYVVLLQHRMEESLAVIAHHMGWLSSGRSLTFPPVGVARRRAPDPNQARAKCADADCRNAVLSCNAIDSRLFDHFSSTFEAHVESLGADFQATLSKLRHQWRGRPATLPPFAGKYPINCQTPGTGPAERQLWKRLHSCAGRRA